MKNDEKRLEDYFCARLHDAKASPGVLKTIRLRNTGNSATTLFDLIDERRYELFKDNSLWNKEPNRLTDVIGGMVPDVVLRSDASSENRIYIEVKLGSPFTHKKEPEASQVVRYLLHLIATTREKPFGERVSDIPRAVLLLAPETWYLTKSHKHAWDYFLDIYRPLATAFGVTLGEIDYGSINYDV